ncbi:CDP-alcohol phosphatidyltransferase family protein [Nakamurella deserti]|uniref:CDP-alcohol phosphatidyltransferase family protein n=1 Tax=Nakamurella deserti TaxID=2164074 RepID=UPI000DBE8951|nr:CDP-alcohol phosphatidyltransferase family protein [Nakamurella deserti]
MPSTTTAGPDRAATSPPTRERYGDVVARLAGAQKHTPGAPAYSRYVNRPLGRRLAAAGYLAGLTPNVITGISAAFSFAGIAVLALARPSWWSGIVVCLALVVGYAFDAADGQLARLRGGGSHAGEWLDHMVDAAKITALHLAVLIAAYRFFDLGSAGWLLVPIGFVLVANVMFFGMILNDLLRARQAAKTGTPVARDRKPSLLRSLLVVPTDYGLLCAVFLLLGASSVFFTVYSLLFVANAAFMALAAVKWFRDMASLDAPRTDAPRPATPRTDPAR